MSSCTTVASASTSTSTALAQSLRTGRSYDAYPIRTTPREVAPGIMDDGTISATHPAVQKFLAYTTGKFLLHETEARDRTCAASIAANTATAKRRSKNRSKSKNKGKSAAEKEAEEEREQARKRAEVGAAVNHWHGQHKHPRVTRWRCMHGGIARVEDVHAALGPEVTDRLAAAIFALAALSVYKSWTDPVHWAFWAVNSVEETAAAVHGVVRAEPRDITVPENVAWVDAEMAVNVLRALHGGFIPRQPKKRQTVSDGEKDDADDEMTVKNANGKRVASEDGEAIPAKRMRTKEPQYPGPTRQSARISIRKATQVETADDDDKSEEVVDDVVECAAELDTTVELEAGSGPEEIDVESIEQPATAELEAESESKAQALPVVPSAKRSRSRPSRPRKTTAGRKPRAPRKPRALSGVGDVPSGSSLPLPAAPSTSSSPSSSTSCTIRIPARSALPSSAPVPALRKLLDEVLPPQPQIVSAPPASGETIVAASRESTAVGTPFSGLSTRVGTPLPVAEAKVEPIAVKTKAKVVREVAAPVRTSARIRAKGLAGPAAAQRR